MLYEISRCKNSLPMPSFTRAKQFLAKFRYSGSSKRGTILATVIHDKKYIYLTLMFPQLAHASRHFRLKVPITELNLAHVFNINSLYIQQTFEHVCKFNLTRGIRTSRIFQFYATFNRMY